MRIKEMFKDDINRNINGVIKVDEKTNVTLSQEVREYVITKDLNFPLTKVGLYLENSIV